jgi:hypothetical protein
MQSFRNDTAVKVETLRRLRAHAAAGEVRNAPTHWQDGAGSPAACMVDDPSLAIWQERLSIPKALGSLVDTIAALLGTAERAAEFGQDWLEAVPIGRDLHGVAHAVLVRLLTDPEHGVIRHATSDPERQMIDRVMALHQQSQSGDKSAVAAWREVRTAATTATDGATTDMQRAVGRTVEAAAWDPATTGMVLSDTARSWTAAEGLAAMDKLGWTERDDRAMRERLKGLFNDAQASGVASDKINVFKLLEQHHPAESARLLAKIAVDRDTPGNCAVVLGAVLIDLTKRAVAPDAVEMTRSA